jgi:hypothetical protein
MGCESCVYMETTPTGRIICGIPFPKWMNGQRHKYFRPSLVDDDRVDCEAYVRKGLSSTDTTVCVNSCAVCPLSIPSYVGTGWSCRVNTKNCPLDEGNVVVTKIRGTGNGETHS